MWNYKARINTPASAGIFLASQPIGSSEICSDLPRHVLGIEGLSPCSSGFLYQRFSSLVRDEACQFPKPTKQNGVQFGDHGSIWGSWPIAFSGYPRGPTLAKLGSAGRLGARDTQRLTNRLRLALEPESREPHGHRQRNSQRWSGLDPRHSSCLWFQMLGVEARSCLPHDEHDGGNFPGQGRTCHLRPDALGQQSCVELLKRPRFARGHDRCTLKQILQIVVLVSVQSANGDLFLRSLQLPGDPTVIGTALCLDAKSAVCPQLPLGAETVRGLRNAQQHGRTDRADRGNLAEPFPNRVFLALCQQLPPHLLTYRPQRIQLLVVKLGPPAHTRFRDLREPFGTMARCIDLLAGTRNGPTAFVLSDWSYWAACIGWKAVCCAGFRACSKPGLRFSWVRGSSLAASSHPVRAMLPGRVQIEIHLSGAGDAAEKGFG